MKTLFEMAGDKIARSVVKGETSLKSVDALDWRSRTSVMGKILTGDYYRWKNAIMKSLALVELQRCKKYEVEWQKTYLDGTRDFREVIYIFHDGDEKYVAEEDEDLTEDEFRDDYIPQIKVKEINYLHDYYYQYQEALHILNPEEDTFGVDSEDANDYW